MTTPLHTVETHSLEAVAGDEGRAAARGPVRRTLVVVADDLGKSREVNRAVALAHDRGILGAASLMAGGAAFDDAVETARARPTLSIGLHVTLCDGSAVLPRARIPDLVGPRGRFREGPFGAGVRYHFGRRRLLPQIEAEVEAQFDRLERAGLHPHHVDGHHHLHMHPLVFDMVCRQASRRGVSWIRLAGEDLAEWMGGGPSLSVPRDALSWFAFGLLRLRGRRRASAAGLRWADRVYGLCRTGRIDERYLEALLPRMRGSINELYTHPDQGTPEGRIELAALLSGRVMEGARAAGISLSSYRQLDHQLKEEFTTEARSTDGRTDE